MIDLEIGSEGGDWSGIIVYRIIGSKAELLVFRYTKDRRTTIKFPGGCCAGGENPFEALGNEIIQETDLELVSREKVMHIWTNKKVPGVHHQHFFATPFSNLQGTMRTIKMEDDDELLGPPFWMSIKEAKDKLFFSHGLGLEHAIRVISETDSEFCYAISEFL
jgi:hypothetical protein